MRISGLRRLAVVAALAAGMALALAVMPGCGSDCPTPEQRAYLNEAENWTDRAEAASEELTTMLQEGGSRPELTLEDEWRQRLKRILDESTSNHQVMIDTDPAPGAEEVHRAIVRVAETVIESNELLWQGVLDVDVETLKRSIERLQEATRLLEEVGAATKRLCQ